MRYDAIPSGWPLTAFHVATRLKVRRAVAQTAMVALGLLLPTLVFRPLAESPAPGVLDVFVRPGFYLTDLAILAVILLGLATRRGTDGAHAQANLTGPLLALAGLALVVVPLALSPVVAGYSALRWMLAVALFIAIQGSDLPVRGLVTGLLAGAIINAILAVGQVVVQAPLGLPGELTLARDVSGAAVVGAERWLRPYGLTFHPNVLGGLLVVGLLMMLPRVTSYYVKILWWLCWAALLLTVSRSAWIALALTMPLAAGWLFWNAPGLRRSLVITVAGSVMVAVAVMTPLRPVFEARLTGDNTPSGQPTAVTKRSINERLALQSVAIGIIKDRPLSGVGAGNTPLAVQSSNVDAAPQPIHNLPLLFAAEVGAAGGGLWIWLWLAPLAMLVARWRRLRKEPASLDKVLPPSSRDAPPLMFALAWLALGTIGLFDFYPWGLESGRLLSVVTLALFARTFNET